MFKHQPHNHSWNAVSVDGSWHLIDAHWATRYLSSEKNMPENLVYEYDDFYFLMEPQQAIYRYFLTNSIGPSSVACVVLLMAREFGLPGDPGRVSRNLMVLPMIN